MIQNADVAARLRLFRYGLVVIVVVTFLVSLLAPYVVTSAYATELNRVADAANADRIAITVTTFFGQALITTIVVAIIMAVVYYLYREWLTRSVAQASQTSPMT